MDVFKQTIDHRAAEAVVEGQGREEDAELSPDGSYLLYVAQPPGSETSPARLMRVPVTGGAPEVLLEQKSPMGFDCPRLAGASCILVTLQQHKISFYKLDPVRGRERKIGEALTPYN